jgi:hypothetical protein
MPALLTRMSTGSEVARNACHAVLASGVVADVELVDGNAGVGLELAGGRIVAGVGGRHPATLVLESNRDRVPDASRTSGNDRNPTHVRFLSVPIGIRLKEIPGRTNAGRGAC